ncbi:10793_t:CDS:2 [Funneliformis mosseae]|uniref:10793_t:CDS:1 n=1 Tax=Funneliformis mosseae TaxID=27381 RepID=A0A9N9AEY9_FUNMO|nr:10793_t:CDS:2 [Funneliformis mosseae]
MVCKKNKRHIQFTLSVNKIQFRSFTVIDTEIQKLVRQCLIVDKIYEVLSYDRKNNCIVGFITQVEKSKKGWLSHRSVAILYQVITTERVVDLLNDAENKDPEMREQIII